MIPKIIHYSWFGDKKPDAVKTRIDSWKKSLPDWEFIEWNEKNWNIDKYDFAKQMFDKEEWAYVTDVLRFDVLYKYGGVYLDTDMVIKKDISSFLKYNLVLGFQYDNSILTSLIMAKPHNEFIKRVLEVYSNRVYQDINAEIYKTTNNPIITKILKKEFKHFRLNGKRQSLQNGTEIFPKDYFSYLSKNVDANFTEHLFMNSWGNGMRGIKGFIKVVIKKVFPYFWVKVSASRGVKQAERDGLKLEK